MIVLRKDIKVLVVEDEIIVAASIKQQLTNSLDLNVLKPVGKGEKAIEVAVSERPDVILMDIVLSTDMNGVEAAREILSIYNPVIIFASGYIDQKISDEIDSLKAFKLYKPYKLEDITTIINTAFPQSVM